LRKTVAYSIVIIMDINWKKNTALFLVGQALSLFGTMIVQYAITWHITLKSQSGMMMAIFTVAGFLPMFFISPFAGVWIDRFNKKYIINIADGAIAFVSLIVAIFLMLGFESYMVLLVCAVVRAFGQGVQTPAVGAFIPEIVPQEQLTKTNGIQSSIQSFITLTSPMIGGVLMTFAPLEILFFLDVVTAFIGICIVFFFVKVPQKENLKTITGEQTKTTYFNDLKEGFGYIKKHGFVLRMIIFISIFSILISPAAILTPLQIARNFGGDVWRLSVMEILFSAGMMLGGLLIGFWGGFKNRIYTMAFACVLIGIQTIGLGLVRNYWVYIAIMAVIGMTVPLYNAPSMVLFQTKVEANYLGRVFSVFTMVSSIMMPLGMVIFGPIADIVSINIILVLTGTGISLLSIVFVTSKTLLNAGRSDE